MKPTDAQRDRARGALVGLAVGDALGAPLEFRPVIPYPAQIGMTGGGGFGWAPGEWTDDTSMAIIVAQSARDAWQINNAALDLMAAGFHDWASDAKDVGSQIRHVLGAARFTGTDAAALRNASLEFTRLNPDRAGNGSLMRTAPVALTVFADVELLAEKARAVSELTHANADAVEACILWCVAIREAIITGNLVSSALAVLKFLDTFAPDRRELWKQRIEAATNSEPWDFPKNGWVVHAFQAAWAAAFCTLPHDGAPTDPFARAVDHAVRCGEDTDTVGAIAGSLVGAAYGLSAIPAEWVQIVHGWPGMRSADLVELADLLLLRSY